MRVHDRRAAILEVLVREEHVSTSTLSSQLGVSSVTIRADLETLEQRGELRRVHGGAVSATPLVETTHDARRGVDRDEKQAIALAALKLLEPGMVVAIDVGTTTLALAEAIAETDSVRDLTVVTTGLRIAASLEIALPRIEVYLTGGALRAQQHSLVNPGVNESLDRMHPNIAFIGTDGIHPELGVTTTNFPEADVKERMRLATDRAVLIAASSKIGETASVRVNAVSAFDTLITAGPIQDGAQDALEAEGIEFLHADSSSSRDHPSP